MMKQAFLEQTEYTYKIMTSCHTFVTESKLSFESAPVSSFLNGQFTHISDCTLALRIKICEQLTVLIGL